MEILLKSLFLIFVWILQMKETSVDGAKILFYFGVGTYSHRLAVWPLVEELSQIHNVTFLSASHPKETHDNENVTEYIPSVLAEAIGKVRGPKSNIIQRRLDGETSFSLAWELQEVGVITCQSLMADKDFVSWIKSTKFDVVVLDALFNDCGLGIAHVHQSKVIIFSTTHPFMWHFDGFGFPTETSFISDLTLGYPHDMTLIQRIVNSLSPLLWHWNRHFSIFPRINKAMNQGLDLNEENAIDVGEMEKNTKLVLINSHFSLDHARSLPPLFVPIGGLHLFGKKKAETLPDDIKRFIDESEGGFIYVSFGSAAMISKLDVELQREFIYALGNCSIRFIWKWEGDSLPEMPSNIFTAKWLPQADILASSKIRGFMTHGGLLSMMEAMAEGVPLILLPIFAEQHYNARRAELIGCGIFLELIGIKQDMIQKAIESILTNPKYKTKMKEMSMIFQDRQNDPLTTAIWWVEYVIRNKANKLLTPGGIRQSWFVRRNLDVWGILIGPLFVLSGFIAGICFKTTSTANGMQIDRAKILKKAQ